MMQRPYSLAKFILMLTCYQLACAQEIMTNRPISSPNGLPVLYPAAPDEQGVSVNDFERLSISERGLVINNLLSTAETQLSGFIGPNPHLKNHSAKLFIFRVNHPHPSFLEGKLEIAGPKADVIISNPWGITCNGCGFINNSTATLTTASLRFSIDNLQNFLVEGGNIAITDKGLDGQALDSLNLISRTLTLNGKVGLSDLGSIKVALGTQQLEAIKEGKSFPLAAAQPLTEYLLDVGELGGMYAGKIVINGTEAASGIKFNGHLHAKQGIQLNYSGDLLVGSRMQLEGDILSTGKINVNIQDISDPTKPKLITTTDNMDLNTAITFTQAEERNLEAITVRVRELGRLFTENTPPPLQRGIRIPSIEDERNRKMALQTSYSQERDTIIANNPDYAHHLQLVWEGKK